VIRAQTEFPIGVWNNCKLFGLLFVRIHRTIKKGKIQEEKREEKK
jgi:hypothetical protein